MNVSIKMPKTYGGHHTFGPIFPVPLKFLPETGEVSIHFSSYVKSKNFFNGDECLQVQVVQNHKFLAFNVSCEKIFDNKAKVKILSKRRAFKKSTTIDIELIGEISDDLNFGTHLIMICEKLVKIYCQHFLREGFEVEKSKLKKELEELRDTEYKFIGGMTQEERRREAYRERVEAEWAERKRQNIKSKGVMRGYGQPKKPKRYKL